MTHDDARTALATAGWRTSRRSQGQNGCVELAAVPGWIGVRDSKLGDASPVLIVPTDHFNFLLAELEAPTR